MPDRVAWTVIERGWRVLAASGQEVARVREIQGDAEADNFHGLLVEKGRLGSSEYVPAEQVAEIREGEVTLARSEQLA